MDNPSKNPSKFDGVFTLNLQIFLGHIFLKNLKQDDIIPLDADAILMIKPEG